MGRAGGRRRRREGMGASNEVGDRGKSVYNKTSSVSKPVPSLYQKLERNELLCKNREMKVPRGICVARSHLETLQTKSKGKVLGKKIRKMWSGTHGDRQQPSQGG